MNTPQERATEYLALVLAGFCPNGTDIFCDAQDVGLAFTVLPKVADDYRILIGYKGRHSRLLRDLMKLWKNANAPNLSIHVFVPNPRMIPRE